MDLSSSGNNYSQTCETSISFFCRKGQLPYILSQRHKIKFFFYSDYVFSIILIFTYGGGYSDASFVRYYCHAHSKVWKDERKWFILVSLNFQTCLLAPPLKISRPHRETRYWGRLKTFEARPQFVSFWFLLFLNSLRCFTVLACLVFMLLVVI